jgi:hypothetical protein
MRIVDASETTTNAPGEKLAPGPALDFVRAIARHMAARDHQQDLTQKSYIDFESIIE